MIFITRDFNFLINIDIYILEFMLQKMILAAICIVAIMIDTYALSQYRDFYIVQSSTSDPKLITDSNSNYLITSQNAQLNVFCRNSTGYELKAANTMLQTIVGLKQISDNIFVVVSGNSSSWWSITNCSISQITQISIDSPIMASSIGNMSHAIVTNSFGQSHHFEYSGSLFNYKEMLLDPVHRIRIIQYVMNQTFLVMACQFGKIWVYEITAGSFFLSSSFVVPFDVNDIFIPQNMNFILVAGYQSQMEVYIRSSNQPIIYQYAYQLPTSSSAIYDIHATPDMTRFAVAGSSNIVDLYQYDEILQQIIPLESIAVQGASYITTLAFDNQGNYLHISSDFDIRSLFRCLVPYCEKCLFFDICILCQSGYNLEENACLDNLTSNANTTNSANSTNNSITNNSTNSTNNNTTNSTNNSTNNNTTNNSTNSTNNNTTNSTTNSTNNSTNNNTTNSTNNSTNNNTTNNSTNSTNNNTTNNSTNSTNNNTTNSTTNSTNINTFQKEQLEQISIGSSDIKLENNYYCVNKQSKDGTAACYDYCPEQCLSCSQYECSQCTPMFSLNQDKSCVQGQDLTLYQQLIPLFLLIRHRNIKFSGILIDDLWMYEYHQIDYKGQPQKVFAMTRMIEQAKNDIIGFGIDSDHPYLNPVLVNYDIYANEKYLAKQRKDDSLTSNITKYLTETVPIIIVLFLCIKILFKLTFHYKISKLLRPIQFNSFLVVMLIQGNIEYFTFLFFRHTNYFFSKDFTFKLHILFSVFFFFWIFLYTIAFYFMSKYFMGKLSKYIFDNVFRMKGSCCLMTAIYGIRPLVRGAIQALLYQNTQLQLLLLSVIDGVLMMMIAHFSIKSGNHINKFRLCCDLTYFGIGILMNYVLKWLGELSKKEQMFTIMDDIFIVLLYTKCGAIVLGIIANFVGLENCCKKQKDSEQQNSLKNEDQQQQMKNLRARSGKQQNQQSIFQHKKLKVIMKRNMPHPEHAETQARNQNNHKNMSNGNSKDKSKSKSKSKNKQKDQSKSKQKDESKSKQKHKNKMIEY